MEYPNNYAIAINEYEALGKEQRESYLYSFVGYSLYLSQNFEKLLMNIIFAPFFVISVKCV